MRSDWSLVLGGVNQIVQAVGTRDGGRFGRISLSKNKP